ncbi:hypothetical protein DFS34DRAFT_590345 [Phlyctochytrium arcticum]|nr:hypothetical protein DFS34DRAFT_590345 [Phlyctochytrium arcticum]
MSNEGHSTSVTLELQPAETPLASMGTEELQALKITMEKEILIAKVTRLRGAVKDTKAATRASRGAQWSLDSDKDDEEDDINDNTRLEMDNTNILDEVPLELKDNRDVDSPNLLPFPVSLRQWSPDGTLNVVLSKSTRHPFINRAPGFKGLSRKLTLELPEIVSQKLAEKKPKIGQRIQQARNYAQERSEALLAALQHLAVSVTAIKEADLPLEQKKKFLAPLYALYIIQADNSHHILDSYRRKVLVGLDMEELNTNDVFGDLRYKGDAKKTKVFDEEE